MRSISTFRKYTAALVGAAAILAAPLSALAATTFTTSSITTTGTLQADGDSTFDTDTLFVDAANNRVGVGTITPAAQLDLVNPGNTGGIPTFQVTSSQSGDAPIFRIFDRGRAVLNSYSSGGPALQINSLNGQDGLVVSGPSITGLKLMSTDATSDFTGIRWHDDSDSQLWSMGNDWDGDGGQDFWLYDSVNDLTPIWIEPSGTSFISFGQSSGGLQYDDTTNELGLFANGSVGFTLDGAGNVGIGDTTPASLLTVGSGGLFQVDSNGDLVRIDNVTYDWPSANAVGLLTNDGNGVLSWAPLSGLDADTLDGLDSASFLRSDATDTFSGLHTRFLDISSDLSGGSRSFEILHIGQANDATNAMSSPLMNITQGDGDSTGAALDIVNNGAGAGLAVASNAMGAIAIDLTNGDLRLSNSASKVKILENGASPSFYGIVDMADLSGADKTYTFPDLSGTVTVLGNTTTGTGSIVLASSPTITTPVISGNLAVNGASLFLDADNAGAGADVDIVANQGSDADGIIRYNATSNQWEFSNNGGAFNAIGSGGGTAAGSTGAVQFNNADAFAADDANFFWDDTNNRLGIGTAAPAVPLEVRAATVSTGAEIARFGGATVPRIKLYDEGGGQGPKISFEAGANARIEGTSNILLMPTGSIGIGTDPSLGKLHVSGDSYFGSGSIPVKWGNGTTVSGELNYGSGVTRVIATAGNTLGLSADGALDQLVIDASGNVSMNAALRGARHEVGAKTANYTVTAAESGALFTNNGAGGAVIFTLPTPAAGLKYTFAVAAAQDLIIDPGAVPQIKGITDAAGDSVTSNDIGETIALASDGSHWYVVECVIVGQPVANSCANGLGVGWGDTN